MKLTRRYIKIVCFILLGIAVSSCDLILLLAANPSKNEIISNLSLESSWRYNLLHMVVIEGEINNNYTYNIQEIKIEATVFDNSGKAIAIEQIKVNEPVTKGGKVTFLERFNYSEKVGNVSTRIISATAY